jgi:GTP cyclohydrolase I
MTTAEIHANGVPDNHRARNDCGLAFADAATPWQSHVAVRPSIDLDAAAGAVSDLLEALGQDPNIEDLRDTPRRAATALAELLTPTPFVMTTFANEDGYDEMVVVRDIPFHSLCAHHLLPFIGVAHVAYVPAERVVGLSKLVRVVDHFARGLQTQERLTGQIAGALDSALAPGGVGVALAATHLCMSLRGVHAPGTETRTTAVTGLLHDNPARRAEFLELTRAPSHTRA